jgi:hypothetical protein
MRYLVNKALFILPILLVSCSDFYPDFHVGDYMGGQIISESGHVVQCSDPEFNKYACMHEDKVAELKAILDSKRQVKVGNLLRKAEKYDNRLEITKTVRNK